MGRKNRNLTAEELALWQYVTRNVKRSPERVLPVATDIADTPVREKAQPISKSSVFAATLEQSPQRLPSRNLILGANDGIDRRTAQRFARGDMKIDARLDLHGMNLAQAESAVTHFIYAASAADYRCVIVVTGKGRRGNENPFDDTVPRGRIRSEAPHWLNRPALRPLILAVREAHFRHGGGGALYVLIKRRRG